MSSMDQFEYLRFLGKGVFGDVSLYKDKSTDKLFVIKVIPNDRQGQKEILVLQKIFTSGCHLNRCAATNMAASRRGCHPILSCYFTSFILNNSLHIVMDYFEGLPIELFVNKINVSYLPKIGNDLFGGLHYLHSLGIAHRDIKLGNILFNEQKSEVQIIDFGLSAINDTKQLAGTPRYIAPELGGSINPPKLKELFLKSHGDIPLRKLQDLQIADIWSMGIVFYYLYMGEIDKFLPLTQKESHDAVFKNKYVIWPEKLSSVIDDSDSDDSGSDDLNNDDLDIDDDILNNDDTISNDDSNNNLLIWKIIELCLITDPKFRPSAKIIHNFFDEILEITNDNMRKTHNIENKKRIKNVLIKIRELRNYDYFNVLSREIIQNIVGNLLMIF